MTTVYVPGTEEQDPKKIIMSLQQIGPRLETVEGAYVTGPASATNNGFAVYDGTTGKLIKNHAATVALASEVSGTLPVANGGTNYTGGAFGSFTPTVTAGSGSITSVSASGRYLAIGKMVFFEMNIAIVTNGTGAAYLSATLPSTAVANYAVTGKQNTSNLMCSGQTAASSNSLTIQYYDGTYPGADGVTIVMSGMYEST